MLYKAKKEESVLEEYGGHTWGTTAKDLSHFNEESFLCLEEFNFLNF